MNTRTTEMIRSLRASRVASFFSTLADYGITSGRILDVGGTHAFWSECGVPGGFHVHLLNVTAQPESECVTSEIGDARDLSKWDDREWQAVFSNSCIGHVGGFTDQMAMAREVMRVSDAYWVQTPNKRFPIDWRTRLPVIHWLPRRARAVAYVAIGKAMDANVAARMISASRDMTIREVRRCFPRARIIPERVCGLVKSVVATGCHG